MNCKYCAKSHSDKDVILESTYWLVVVADEQSYLGRCVVILKRHANGLPDLSSQEWQELQEVIIKLEKAIRESFEATMFNWTFMANNFYKSKPYDAHIHAHVRPRYDHTVEFEGEKFEDLEFGDHYNRDRKRTVSEDLMLKIGNKIKNSL